MDTVTRVNGSGAERRLTRRQLLLAGGVGAASLVLTSADRVTASHVRTLVSAIDAPRVPAFFSRPDLRIPALAVMTPAGAVAPGMILLAPYNAPNNAQAGPVIVDNGGEPVWELPLAGLVTTDFRVQTYRDAPALTWWQGVVRLGHGVGGYVIADASYHPLAHINAGNGHQGDLHEFLLTDRGTALLTTYVVTRHDLRAVGGAADGTIQDAIFQEIDVATGRVLLEWHSLDHIPITESYWPRSLDWDYVHLNSIAVDNDQQLLVSSRNTHTIYKIDRATGEIIWRLGGKHSDFSLAPDAVFAWQHDARRQADGSITLLDNGDRVSRALVLAVDERNRRVTVRRAYTHPAGLHATSQGNVQILPNGNVLVGWGAEPYVSEFAPDGELVFDALLGVGYVSYRAFRMPWIGDGDATPAIAAQRGARHTDVYVSWNGDTRTAYWTALAGTAAHNLMPIGRVARTGFETGMRIPAQLTRVQVRASDASGRTLAQSRIAAV